MISDKCQHEFYKTSDYMQWDKAIKDPKICWIGRIEKTCKDCNSSIEFARRVRVKTAGQYIKSLN